MSDFIIRNIILGFCLKEKKWIKAKLYQVNNCILNENFRIKVYLICLFDFEYFETKCLCYLATLSDEKIPDYLIPRRRLWRVEYHDW